MQASSESLWGRPFVETSVTCSSINCLIVIVSSRAHFWFWFSLIHPLFWETLVWLCLSAKAGPFPVSTDASSSSVTLSVQKLLKTSAVNWFQDVIKLFTIIACDKSWFITRLKFCMHVLEQFHGCIKRNWIQRVALPCFQAGHWRYCSENIPLKAQKYFPHRLPLL